MNWDLPLILRLEILSGLFYFCITHSERETIFPVFKNYKVLFFSPHLNPQIFLLEYINLSKYLLKLVFSFIETWLSELEFGPVLKNRENSCVKSVELFR